VDKFRPEIADDGVLRLVGREDFREAACSVCRQPIRWVLDMFSFRYDPPGYSLAHARCVWTSEAFAREGLAAERVEI